MYLLIESVTQIHFTSYLMILEPIPNLYSLSMGGIIKTFLKNVIPFTTPLGMFR